MDINVLLSLVKHYCIYSNDADLFSSDYTYDYPALLEDKRLSLLQQ